MTTRGLGDNPLDRPRRRMPAVIPTTDSRGEDRAGGDASAAVGEQAIPVLAKRASNKSIRAGRAQLTCYIDEAISEEARDAIMYLANDPDGPVNLSDLVNRALHQEIGRLRTAHHAGKPFPPRKRPLRVGRPV